MTVIGPASSVVENKFSAGLQTERVVLEWLRLSIEKDRILAKSNYRYEKRQKELAKKKKKEEKRQRKLDKGNNEQNGNEDQPEEE